VSQISRLLGDIVNFSSSQISEQAQVPDRRIIMEYLKNLSVREEKENKFSLHIQLTGGGAGVLLNRGNDVITITYQLRRLADRLEKGVEERSK
jgi:hypothetical protein